MDILELKKVSNNIFYVQFIYLKIFLMTIKKIIIAIAILLIQATMFGQAREASVKIDKEKRPAVMININRSQEITENALKERLERAGLKDRIRKGDGIYKGVVFSEISPEKLDFYTKVEKASKNRSIVYMAVSRGYDNFIEGTSDSLITERIKNFLNSFVQDADNEFSDVQISSQVKDLKKERKSYERLLKDQKKLERQKNKIEKQLEAIQNKTDVARNSLDTQKSDLEDAEEDRENN